MQTNLDNLNRVLREQITGIRVIRAFIREDHESRRFERANDDVYSVTLRASRLLVLLFPFAMFMVNVSSVAVIWFGAFRIDSGAIQLGQLTAFLNYLIQILISVLMSTMLLTLAPRAAVSADRILEVLDTEPTVAPPANPVTPKEATGVVEFRDVTFTYPGADTPALSDLSFTLKPGRTTAIIGSTGSGKSTLVNLIPRLFDATGGEVLMDGVDVRQLDPDALWSRIGLVPQKPYLFSGTVASNLRYGRPDATDEQMWERCASPRPRTSSRSSKAASGRASHKAVRTYRAVSGSACRSPGPWSRSLPSTSSTTPSRPSTSRPTPGCVPHSPRRRQTAPR